MYNITRAYGLDFTIHDSDTGIGPILARYGEFSRVQLDLISEYVALYDSRGAFIDVGANIGTICLPVAAQHGECRVIAVEANRITASLLAANAVNNSLGNVEVLHAAIGSSAGLADFPTPSGDIKLSYGELSLKRVQDVKTEKVRLCTLDEIAPSDTCLVKIDVEGFEAEVMAGASRVIRELRPIWSIEANPAARPVTRSVMSTLLDADYRLFWLLTPFISPKPYRDVAPAGWIIDMNFMALPRGRDNIWELPEIVDPDAAWVTDRKSYKFLQRYA